MIRTIAGWLAAICVGATIGYYFGSRDGSAPSSVAHPSRVANSSNAAPDTAVPASEKVPGAQAGPQAAERTAPRTPDPDIGVSNAAPMPAATLGLPGGNLDARDRDTIPPLDKLLGSMSVFCTFDPGAGGQWPKGRIFPHTAAWQGGPIEFDAINLAEHSALMTRHPWAVASAESAVSVSATATGSGVHFSGFNPEGELLALTVFGALDFQGRYRAVLSLHGTKMDHESAQFYGWCTNR